MTLKRAQVCFGASTCVQLLGTGRKERTVPLWPDTAHVLKAWFAELGEDAGPLACPNARGKALSRGAQMTSADAAIKFRNSAGKIEIALIEPAFKVLDEGLREPDLHTGIGFPERRQDRRQPGQVDDGR